MFPVKQGCNGWLTARFLVPSVFRSIQDNDAKAACSLSASLFDDNISSNAGPWHALGSWSPLRNKYTFTYLPPCQRTAALRHFISRCHAFCSMFTTELWLGLYIFLLVAFQPPSDFYCNIMRFTCSVATGLDYHLTPRLIGVALHTTPPLPVAMEFPRCFNTDGLYYECCMLASLLTGGNVITFRPMIQRWSVKGSRP